MIILPRAWLLSLDDHIAAGVVIVPDDYNFIDGRCHPG